uniref:Photosystem I assembly protein Ycf4 n=1 Tax=Rhipiliopsis peltata TaxID=2320810 RepID=A0A386B1B2_9CHLO|nr:photosystem I assembly protein Ycf4 [Rhipiliopsis peltata]AYC65477.1 photosystem I assembly protein Ycf4 [Rhipiliopsis peltata]
MQKDIRRYSISGARRLSNFWWTSILFLGSSGFLLTGLACYFQKSLLILGLRPSGLESQASLAASALPLQFFPQGLVMIFYGFLGFFLSLYLGLTLFWGLGSGFNEFNKREAYVRIFRWGFPGQTRRINFYYPWEDILGIRVEFQKGFVPLRNSQYTLFLQIRGNVKRTKGDLDGYPKTYQIPLTHIGEPLTFEEMEKQASALAKFLQVSLNMQHPESY